MKRYLIGLCMVLSLVLGLTRPSPAASGDPTMGIGQVLGPVYFGAPSTFYEARNFWDTRSVEIWSVQHYLSDGTPGFGCLPGYCDWEEQYLISHGWWASSGEGWPWYVSGLWPDYKIISRYWFPEVVNTTTHKYYIIRCWWDDGTPLGDKSWKGWPSPPTYPSTITPSFASLTYRNSGIYDSTPETTELVAPKGVVAVDYAVGFSEDYFWAIPMQHFYGYPPTVQTLYGFSRRYLE